MHDKYLKINKSILVKKLQLMVIFMLNVKVSFTTTLSDKFDCK
jgi:hypothetical protein